MFLRSKNNVCRRIEEIFMKAKKLIPLLALVLGFSAFAGCTNSDKKVRFGNYWNVNALDTTKEAKDTEILEYDITFKAAEVSLVDYKVDYSNGKYTTRLEYVEAEDLYVYTTALNITAQYTFNGETKSVDDSITSEVKFRSGEYSLQPVSSKKEIVGSTPLTVTPETVDDCFTQFHYTLETTYNADCSEGTSVITNIPAEGEPYARDNDFEIEQKKFSYLDNEQLLFALRGIPNSTSSATVLVYSPFANAVQKVSMSYATEESAEFTFLKNGAEQKGLITYRPISLVLDEQNPGATQTVWIAKYEDATANKNRNVMLRLETPLSYGLGTLTYTLKSVSYQ